MPTAIATAIATHAVAGSFAAVYATEIAWTIVIASTVAYSSYAKRKMLAAARAAANANLKDREVMVRSAVAPRRYVYGRDRISGPVIYMESTGDKKQFLHLVVALASHECEEIESIYFNDVLLPALDGSGFVTSGQFYPESKSLYMQEDVVSNGSGVATLSLNAIDVLNVHTGTNDTYENVVGWSHTEGSPTITGLPVSTTVNVAYHYNDNSGAKVRIKKHLGADSQTADTDLVAESDGKWTTAHRARGICYLYVRLEYDQDIFGSIGVPNISAIVKGKKVYDPRSTLTAWTNNAALCAADFLQAAEGFRAAAVEVPDDEVIAAANICDELIDLVEGGAEQQARYTCDLSYTSDQAPRDALGDILQSMAGRAVWTQGRWLLRAGAYVTPTVTITADSLVGGISVIPRTSRSDLFNSIRATYRDPAQNYAVVQAPIVTNSGYEVEDGSVRITRQMEIATAAESYRAQRLGKIELERARQALTVRLTTNLTAYDIAPSDTVMLTLGFYGWTSKVFECIERTLNKEGNLVYTLRETASGVWAWNYGEATIGDLAPNTTLPSPYTTPAPLTGLTITEGAYRLFDGATISTAIVSWALSTDAFVAGGGRIEIEWRAADADQWTTSAATSGDSVSATIEPLRVGVTYIVRVRPINAVGRIGDWTYGTLDVVGFVLPPSDVTGLDYEIKPGQVRVFWDACPDPDYARTELHVGASWAAGDFLFSGAVSEYHHPRPANGTYDLWACHQNRRGDYSTTPTHKSVTVDDSIDPTAADAQVLSLYATGFAFVFSDVNDTSADTPSYIDFTASLQNITGTVTFGAVAYNAAGGSLGSVTLTNVTDTTCRLTAANFNAAGALTVRSVRVTATISTLTDIWTVYRGDGGSSAIQAVLSNEAHTLPSDESGNNVTYTGSGTDVAVFEGTTALDYDGVGTAAGKWKATPTDTNITHGSFTDSGTYLTVGQASAMTADRASISFAISGKSTTGAAFALTKVQSLAKSKAGVPAFAGELTVSAITVAAAADGTGYSLAGTGGTFKCWYGPAEVTGGSVTYGISGGTDAGSTIYITQSGLTWTITKSTGVYALTGASWTTDSVSVTVTAAYGGVTIGKVYTITKSKAGATGGAGSQGASARIAYALYASNYYGVQWDASPYTTRTVSGDTLPGAATLSNPDAATAWTSAAQTPSSGQSMFQVDGIYDPVANQTVWGAPYLSNFRVGSLSAISADLGTITAGTITGATLRTAASGSRIEMSGNTLKSTNSGGSNLIEITDSGKVSFTGGAYDPLGGSNYAAAAAAVGTSTNASAIVGFYGYNLKSSGGQAVRGETSSGNSAGIGVMGSSNSSGSVGGYFANSYGGLALQVLGKTQINLNSSEMGLHNSSAQLRLKTTVPGVTTGYGVVVANDDTSFKIGVTSNGSAESAAATTPLAISLSTGAVSYTGQIVSTYASGSPFTVASTTLITNLNADKLDGYDIVASGAWWSAVPTISSGGVIEGMAYIDMQASSGATIDYGARFSLTGGSSLGQGQVTLTQKDNVAYYLLAGINSDASGSALSTVNVPSGRTPTLKWMKVPYAGEAGGWAWIPYVI